MSLFKLKEWCSIQVGDGSEVFDFGCLWIGNLLDDQNKSAEQIVIASQSGVLRLYDFGSKSKDDTSDAQVRLAQVKPEHLLLEKNLGVPIVEICGGRFVSGAEKKFLAVLHPRKLSVYSFKTVAAGKVEYSDQYDVQLAYEHQLARTAFNFICGPFGGVKGRDFLCVQSLDCTLSFYEEENFAFTRFLPGSLLPGPIAYVAKSDSFVTISSNWQVESYKYQVLAVAADSKTKEDAANMTSGKRVAMDWAFNLGENALDVVVVDLSPAPSSIIVLGERSVFCLSDSGELRFMKKFEFNPACFLAYSSTSEGYLQYVIATHTQTLLLFADTTLKWTCQLTSVPICLRISGVRSVLRGMITMISDDGTLTCGYLGTDPAFYGIPVGDTRNVDYYQKQKEYKKLQAIIKNSNKSLDLNQHNTKVEELSVICIVPSKLDEISLAYDSQVEDAVPSITVRIKLNAKLPLDNVQLFVSPPAVIVAQSNAFALPSLVNNEEIPVTFFLKYSYVPSSLVVKVRAVYSVSGSGSKSVRTQFQLPLHLIAKPAPPTKMNTVKITIDTNKAIVSMADLFPEFANTGDALAIGFQIFGKMLPAVSILASSQSQKYRIQSESYELIWIFLFELCNRLKLYFSSSSDFQLSYSAQLPLAEYFTLIDRHFELRKQKERAKEVLAQKSGQFRTVERQLLMKLQGDTPTPLSHLDELVNATYRQIITLINAVIDVDTSLASLCSSLSAATSMHIFLMKLSYQLSPSEFDLLEVSFSPDVDEQQEQIWEEQVDAAVTYLLQTISKGHASSVASEQEMQRLAESTRFKKHVTLLCDKLAKGARLMTPDGKKATDKKKIANFSNDSNRADISDEGQLGDGELPKASTFGDLSNQTTRQLSQIAEEAEAEEDEFYVKPTKISNGSNKPEVIQEEDGTVKEAEEEPFAEPTVQSPYKSDNEERAKSFRKNFTRSEEIIEDDEDVAVAEVAKMDDDDDDKRMTADDILNDL